MTNLKETEYKFEFEKFKKKDDINILQNKIFYGHKFFPDLIGNLFNLEKKTSLRNYYHNSHLGSSWTKSFLVMPNNIDNKVIFRNSRSSVNLNFGYMKNKLMIPEQTLLKHPSYKYIKEKSTTDLGVIMLLKDVHKQIEEHFKTSDF
tara:strand:+ start:1348 stop:1788 length:441 start_codon:yes stop_codon:yes gene_type:complete